MSRFALSAASPVQMTAESSRPGPRAWLLRDGRHGRGFTLIEMMVTVAIVAILAAIAIPSYTQYLRKGRRADGTSCLLQYRDRMERFYQRRNAYPDKLSELAGDAGGSAAMDAPICPGESSQYRVNLLAADGSCVRPNCYVLTATPNPGKAQASDGLLQLESHFSVDPNERIKKKRIVGGVTKDNWDDY